jgi:hypothetical protein
MFFTFPEDARWNARSADRRVRGRGRRVSRHGSGPAARVPTAAPGDAHPREMRRGLPPPADPVREHRRAEAAPASASGGWERGDQWTGFAGQHFWGSGRPETVAMMSFAQRARVTCRCCGLSKCPYDQGQEEHCGGHSIPANNLSSQSNGVSGNRSTRSIARIEFWRTAISYCMAPITAQTDSSTDVRCW